jgi:flagellar hook-basal body complex protein FliE|tara:strand:- start:81 stop:362 length:282 start_codon:yes stop_codon:yes gene_type:complete
MGIQTNLVAQNYAAGKTAMAPTDTPDNGFANVAQDFLSTLQSSEKTAMSTMTSGADPFTLVQALAQTELAVQTAVTVRDKVVEAYQEILRMPV